MASAGYVLRLDVTRSNTFSADITNITRYLLKAQYSWGMGDAYQTFAPPSRMELWLDNRDGEFSPDTLGSELLTNGSFASWTADNPNSWTVAGEVGADPEISEVGENEAHGGSSTGACNFYESTGAATVSIAQTVLTVGLSYRVTLRVAKVTSGGVRVYNGSTAVSPPYQEAGDYTIDFNATDTSLKIQNHAGIVCDVTIDNVTCKQTSLYGGLLRKGTVMFLDTEFNATTYIQFYGIIGEVSHSIGRVGNRIVKVMVEDPSDQLYESEYIPRLIENALVSDVIMEILDGGAAPYPYAHTFWLLGVQGSSELGQTTTLYEARYELDASETTFAYVGDVETGTEVGADARNQIARLVAAENGRFFFDQVPGQWKFQTRHADSANTLVAATLTDADYEADMTTMSMNADLVNVAAVTFQPRKVGAAGSVIWTATNIPITIKAKQTYKTTARYRDATDQTARVGAKNYIAPFPGQDYVVTNTGGTPIYTDVSISVNFGANSAEVVLNNSSSEDRIITTLQLRATPITAFDSRTVTYTNQNSIYAYRRSEKAYSLPAISDEEYATRFAEYHANKFGTPVNRIAVLGFNANKSHARMLNALDVVIGDRISVSDSWSSHSTDYIVVGIRHEVTMGGEHTHNTYWTLKPRSREVYWRLGVAGASELGETTRLTF